MIILPDYIIYTVTMKFTHNKHRTVREAPGCCPIFPQAFQLPKSLGFLWMFHHFPHLDRWMFAIFKSQGRPVFFGLCLGHCFSHKATGRLTGAGYGMSYVQMIHGCGSKLGTSMANAMGIITGL